MKNILIALCIAMIFCACSSKKTEGTIRYTVEYLLPDSLKHYAENMPKQATVYFKGDSAVSVQQTKDESTSVITDAKTGFMRALLKSVTKQKQYAVDYDKTAQAQEAAAMPSYTYLKSNEHKNIAGYDATRYILKDKLTGESSEAWFTKDVAIIPSSLTSTLDTALGVPLAFTLKQSGIIVKTTVTEVKFEPTPLGAFNTPKGYEFLTPQQFNQLMSGY